MSGDGESGENNAEWDAGYVAGKLAEKLELPTRTVQRYISMLQVAG